MKVELTIRQVWTDTNVILEGDKHHIEKIVEVIKEAFKNDTSVRIR